MAVDGIEIKAGQQWRTRAGREATIDKVTATGQYPALGFVKTEGSPRGEARSWTAGGLHDNYVPEGDFDLVQLIQDAPDADGWHQWGGGEQPEHTDGKFLEYRMRTDDPGRFNIEDNPGRLRWAHTGGGSDIVAYRIVTVTAEPVAPRVLTKTPLAVGQRWETSEGWEFTLRARHDGHERRLHPWEATHKSGKTKWFSDNGECINPRIGHLVTLLNPPAPKGAKTALEQAAELLESQGWTFTAGAWVKPVDDEPLVVAGPFDVPGYEPLANVLIQAYNQAARGKGKERHANAKPFLHQPILEITRMQGSVDGLVYQVHKKSGEAKGLPYPRNVAEYLGSIVYAAAAVILAEELNDERTSTEGLV